MPIPIPKAMVKRILIVVGSVTLLALVGVGGAIGWAFVGRKAASDGVEFGSVRIVLDGFSACGVIDVGGGKVALIDAGNDVKGTALLEELARRGLGPEAVTAIFITHGHADHTGAVGLFPQASVMALEREVAIVEGREGSTGPMTRLMPVSPTGITVSRPLRDGETVTIGNTDVRVFSVPGHTAGSAAYLVRGVLFVGDSADQTSEGALQGSPWIFSDSQATNRASLARLDERLRGEGFEVSAIVPAHSGAFSDGLLQLDVFAREHSSN